jgi:hypothetical protein
VEAELHRSLAARLADRVMKVAQLPAARRGDVEEAAEFAIADTEICCRCKITGSTYTAVWDGSEATANRLADEAADGMAYLLAHTPHYAWLRSNRQR